MSKQAEQKAIERYPITAENGERAFLARGFFVKGYEQAEKETIERAVAWLKDNANKYIVDLTETCPDIPVNIVVGGKCWDDLKEFLEKE